MVYQVEAWQQNKDATHPDHVGNLSENETVLVYFLDVDSCVFSSLFCFGFVLTLAELVVTTSWMMVLQASFEGIKLLVELVILINSFLGIFSHSIRLDVIQLGNSVLGFHFSLLGQDFGVMVIETIMIILFKIYRYLLMSACWSELFRSLMTNSSLRDLLKPIFPELTLLFGIRSMNISFFTCCGNDASSSASHFFLTNFFGLKLIKNQKI